MLDLASTEGAFTFLFRMSQSMTGSVVVQFLN